MRKGRNIRVFQEILDSKIDKRMKDPLTGKKGCLLYKIRYTGYEDKRPE